VARDLHASLTPVLRSLMPMTGWWATCGSFGSRWISDGPSDAVSEQVPQPSTQERRETGFAPSGRPALGRPQSALADRIAHRFFRSVTASSAWQQFGNSHVARCVRFTRDSPQNGRFGRLGMRLRQMTTVQVRVDASPWRFESSHPHPFPLARGLRVRDGRRLDVPSAGRVRLGEVQVNVVVGAVTCND
jgi:hypothetical protein